MMDVWPVTLKERLPTVPVPLLPEDPDVPLDLQAALAGIYDVFGYDLLVDYSKPPDVPLAEADAAWAHEQVRGRRGGQ